MVWLVKTGFDFGHAIANITRAWGADINVVEVDAAAVDVLVHRLAEKGGETGERTKKLALVQESRPVKTAMRVVECIVVVVVVVVVVVLVVVVKYHFKTRLSGCLIYL